MYNGHVVNRIYKYGKFVWPGLVFILGLILLAVGLWRDADAAASLFGSLPAIVVTLVSVIAPFPFFVFIGMAGSLIGVAVRGKHERLPWYSYLIATAVSIASGILFGYLVLVECLDSALLSYSLGAVVVLLVALPFMLLEKDASGELAVRLASAVLVPSVLALALLFTLRLGFPRPVYAGDAVEDLAMTAFPATVPLLASASFVGLSLMVLLPGKRDKALFIAGAAFAILSILGAAASLSGGASYLTAIGISFLIGTFLGLAFAVLLVMPYFYCQGKKKLVYKSPVTPAIKRRQLEELRAQANANALRLRRKNNSFKAVVPADEPSLLSRRRNYLHHK